MGAYAIAYLEITDPPTFEVYRRAAGPTFAPYGGKPLVVDGRFEVVEGFVHPKSIVVVEFENLEQAVPWPSGRPGGVGHPVHAQVVGAEARSGGVIPSDHYAVLADLRY